MNPNAIDRRRNNRDEALFLSRRRYPRLAVRCDVFYESADRSLHVEHADLTLRGLFVPTCCPDPEGTRAVVRFDTGEGPLVRAEVEVVRATREQGRRGMALVITAMNDESRAQLAAFLLTKGGLAMFPQLDRRYSTLARAPRPSRAGLAA